MNRTGELNRVSAKDLLGLLGAVLVGLMKKLRAVTEASTQGDYRCVDITAYIVSTRQSVVITIYYVVKTTFIMKTISKLIEFASRFTLDLCRFIDLIIQTAHKVALVSMTASLCHYGYLSRPIIRRISLSGEPDYFGRNKILSGYDLSHYQVPHCIRVFFYFVWFVFIHHNFQFYFKLCTYCNILDIYLS